MACEKALRQYIQSLRVSFNMYDLQGYKNIFILIITFILFSINYLSTRCPISRKSRTRELLFHPNKPKMSQEWIEASLVYMVSVSWWGWSTAAFAEFRSMLCHRKPPQFRFTIQSFLDSYPFLYYCSPKQTIVPQALENLQSNFLLWWKQSISTPSFI